VGVLFRGADKALQPNYTHIPVGYHGRSSSIVVSGTRIRRPFGPIILDSLEEPKLPTITACRKLDIELELGAFVCNGNRIGEPILVSNASENLFGFVLLNDWSARDIQAFEYVPLGPFNGKNFSSTISPWVVLVDALEPFRAKGLDNATELMSYLIEEKDNNVYDIKLSVDLTTPGPEGATTTITNTSSTNLLWSFEQMIAHHTIGGCNLRTGDLLGSGTISGTERGEFGSLLEQSENGKKDIMLAGMDVRTFLKDGDKVTITGVCGDDPGALVGFGDCVGTIESALWPQKLSTP
jgi:fumarylacetoacetase